MSECARDVVRYIKAIEDDDCWVSEWLPSWSPSGAVIFGQWIWPSADRSKAEMIDVFDPIENAAAALRYFG
jgi:hypothetical protein